MGIISAMRKPTKNNINRRYIFVINIYVNIKIVIILSRKIINPIILQNNGQKTIITLHFNLLFMDCESDDFSQNYHFATPN